MGRYINHNSKGQLLPALNKAESLIRDGAIRVDGSEFVPNMVCVVTNDTFDAALYCDEWQEFARVKRSGFDPRPKIWLQYEHAEALAK